MARVRMRFVFSGVVLLLALIVPLAHGDVLLMNKIQNAPANSAEGVLRPVGGMRMERVLEKFGEPKSRIPAVGEPPITRWVYDEFTVYFENRHTITAVLRP